MTTTLNGLHSCKPGNEPIVGQVKTFLVEQRTSKNGKPWLKIKSAGADNGGSPYRILNAEQTDFVDNHGNISFRLEIEAANGEGGERPTEARHNPLPQRHDPPSSSNGVDEARKHIMQSANLYVLCVAAVNSYVAAHLPEVAQTSEMFQAATGTLFIEASREGYVSKMPTSPIK
jgi:hypothetical protein